MIIIIAKVMFSVSKDFFDARNDEDGSAARKANEQRT